MGRLRSCLFGSCAGHGFAVIFWGTGKREGEIQEILGVCFDRKVEARKKGNDRSMLIIFFAHIHDLLVASTGKAEWTRPLHFIWVV